MLQTLGIAYPAIFVKDMQESLNFYRRLGLQPLYVEPNRDDEESICAMLATGDGSTFLQLVGPTHPDVDMAEASPGVGSLQYLSFHVSMEQMHEIYYWMASAGVKGSEEIARGYERLVFMEDPNGVMIVLIAWETEPPEGMSLPRVLARAAKIRDAAGVPFVEDEHIKQAIAELQAEG
ncbi:MAG: VOC family protein [Dehalococcoidia bacterium]